MLSAWLRFFFGRPRSLLPRVLRFLPPAIFMAGIFYISGKPPADVPGWVRYFVSTYLRGDGMAHFLAYATLAAAIIWALWPNFRSGRWSIVLGWLLSSAYGAMDECHQLFVPERSASVRELLIDSLGALAVCVIWAGVCLVLRRVRSAAAISSQALEENGGTDKFPETAAQSDDAAP